ncbi:MAG: twin-arginine translocation signal domain-containing protein, partial [Planctomycetota bacterium]
MSSDGRAKKREYSRRDFLKNSAAVSGLAIASSPYLHGAARNRDGETGSGPKNVQPSRLADPLIDTDTPRFDYFASAAVPFGMVALSPDTRHGRLWNAGYRYGDDRIISFSHVHNVQMGGIPVMPVTGECRGHRGLKANGSPFSHDDEEIQLGYHRVTLDRYDITAELTATCRTGLHRYTFPECTQGHLLFDLSATMGPNEMQAAEARRMNGREVEGCSVMAPTVRRKKPFTVYFVARVDTPFDDFAGWKQAPGGEGRHLVEPGDGHIEGPQSGFYLTYRDLQDGTPVRLKVGISYVSTEQARLNLDTELPGWNVEETRRQARAAWDDYLGR